MTSRESSTCFVVQHISYREFHDFIIEHWFAHTHKHDISYCSTRPIIFESEFGLNPMVKPDDLSQRLCKIEVFAKS